MARKVIISCALTGGAQLAKNSQYVPITPAQIADEAIAARRAGAAIAHIHVRDPQTGAPSMAFALYKEVVDRIRDSGSDVIINLTTGPGARFAQLPDASSAATLPQTAAFRTSHIAALRPDICSLDVATMNFGEGSIVNQPATVRAMARTIRENGVKPELEVFELGHLRLANALLAEGVLPELPFFQLCLGIQWGAGADVETMLLMRNMLPKNAIWSAFGIGRSEMPVVAQSVLLGGHVRVGLEDNLYLRAGELAKGNAPLVERAVAIVESLGEEVASPEDARTLLALDASRGTPPHASEAEAQP
tara:strand:+ start:1627 stop:2541 length:915 start_codon:yes stop_codon:yes gene_type:complete